MNTHLYICESIGTHTPTESETERERARMLDGETEWKLIGSLIRAAVLAYANVIIRVGVRRHHYALLVHI